MMTVVVSKLSWIVSVVFLISVVALVGYQFRAKTPLAHYQLWYPLSTAKENAAPGPNTSNRSEVCVLMDALFHLSTCRFGGGDLFVFFGLLDFVQA